MARAARFPVPMASAALQLYLMTAAAGMAMLHTGRRHFRH